MATNKEKKNRTAEAFFQRFSLFFWPKFGRNRLPAVVQRYPGGGMNGPEQVETFFEPFTPQLPAGTGLGLFNCLSIIIRDHSGQSTCASPALGEGTTIYDLRFPVTQNARCLIFLTYSRRPTELSKCVNIPDAKSGPA